ncbi:MAG: thioesterase family protein [Cyclobacteriaceae bacterium]|nr:thioesterase family protein [Cyclobacteriaceae bacterium]MCH8515203.1 thioesterase family protein [Cyclobacteriaceae bacterium]
MARIKINLPEKFIFQTKIQVRVTDLNYGAHVGNDTVLAYAHQCRFEYILSLGFEGEVYGIDGMGIIMADAAVQYLGEMKMNENIQIDLGFADFHPYGMDMICKMTNLDQNKESARVKAGIIFFNYHEGHKILIPETFKEKAGL